MKTLKYIIILSALLCSAFLNAQTFHLKMEIVAETSTDFTIDIFASGDPGFELGSSNLVFDFDPLVVSNPTLVSHNLTEMTGPFTVYSDVNVTEPASGKASLNIVLDATGVGDLMDTYPAYTNIAQIHFDVLDASATKSLNWLYTGGSTETVVFLDDEMTQLFVAVPSSDLLGISGILPIDLSEFVAGWSKNRSANQIVELLWKTEKEVNASHFIIERSHSGAEWTKIDRVEAEGVSKGPQSYSYFDSKTVRNQTDVVYYRLRLVDRDDKYEFSEIAVLRGDVSTTQDLQVFPTVFADEITVIIPSSEREQHFDIQIYDLTGRRVFGSSSLQTTNIVSGLEDLQGGCYILTLTKDQDIKYSTRIIKQDSN